MNFIIRRLQTILAFDNWCWEIFFRRIHYWGEGVQLMIGPVTFSVALLPKSWSEDEWRTALRVALGIEPAPLPFNSSCWIGLDPAEPGTDRTVTIVPGIGDARPEFGGRVAVPPRPFLKGAPSP